MPTDYYKSKASVEEYIRLAKDVNGSELIGNLKRFLPKNSTLLEIGTGPGTDWKLLDEDYQVVGSDNSLQFLDHLHSSIPNGRFIELDAVSLPIDEKFEGIYSNKVMHHLKDHELRDSIVRQSEILKPNGIICHSFWKGEGSEVFKGLFVNYHTEESIRLFFDQHFEILMIESYREFEADDSFLLIGKKRANTELR